MEVFLEPVLLLFWTKKPINIRFLKFFVKKKNFKNFLKKKKQKPTSQKKKKKNTVPNTMATDLW